ncbi:hypothetical protein TB2_002615 [Malus domestica]|uniref:protein DMP5-like n=1 Tax=Malus sylvestris TaxID=3752 RepID=UPI0021ACE89D|nr:protein DMP5-like [Malus sylvestris]
MDNNSIIQDLIESTEEHDDDPNNESNFMSAMNAILSGTARLNVLLPTAPVISFTIFTPLFTNDGVCTPLNRWLTGFFIALSAASCVFFTLTDSFKTATGRLYYGVATFRGIRTFNGGRKKPRLPSDYRLRWADLFHASLSVVAFLAFAALHYDVVGCYYPAMPRRVTNVLPLVVGFVVSVLFVLFPSKRRGIGYPFLLQREAFYSRC